MEQDVLGFDIAVDDMMTVGVVQGGGDLAGDSERLFKKLDKVMAPKAA